MIPGHRHPPGTAASLSEPQRASRGAPWARASEAVTGTRPIAGEGETRRAPQDATGWPPMTDDEWAEVTRRVRSLVASITLAIAEDDAKAAKAKARTAKWRESGAVESMRAARRRSLDGEYDRLKAERIANALPAHLTVETLAGWSREYRERVVRATSGRSAVTDGCWNRVLELRATFPTTTT